MTRAAFAISAIALLAGCATTTPRTCPTIPVTHDRTVYIRAEVPPTLTAPASTLMCGPFGPTVGAGREQHRLACDQLDRVNCRLREIAGGAKCETPAQPGE